MVKVNIKGKKTGGNKAKTVRVNVVRKAPKRKSKRMNRSNEAGGPPMAAVATGMSRMTIGSGQLERPVMKSTKNLMDTINLGTEAQKVVFAMQISPQAFPEGSTAKVFSTQYAKWRLKRLRINITGGGSTAISGQMALHWDPDPTNPWLSNQIGTFGRLTSLPFTVPMMVWESRDLEIPLGDIRNRLFFTDPTVSDALLTTAGQVLVSVIIAPTASPPPQVTMWIMADWQFIQPTVSNYFATPSAGNVEYASGNWQLTNISRVSGDPPDSVGITGAPSKTQGSLTGRTVYHLSRPFPNDIFEGGLPETGVQFVTVEADGSTLIPFVTYQGAVNFANSPISTNYPDLLLVVSPTTTTLPALDFIALYTAK